MACCSFDGTEAQLTFVGDVCEATVFCPHPASINGIAHSISTTLTICRNIALCPLPKMYSKVIRLYYPESNDAVSSGIVLLFNILPCIPSNANTILYNNKGLENQRFPKPFAQSLYEVSLVRMLS